MGARAMSAPGLPLISKLQAGVERRKALYQEATVRQAYLKRDHWTQPLYADLDALPPAIRQAAVDNRRDHLTDQMVEMESICEARGYGVPPEKDRDLEDTGAKIERFDAAVAGGMDETSAALMYGDFRVREPGCDDEKNGALARLEIARRHPERRAKLFCFNPANPDPELRDPDAWWGRVLHHSVDHLHLLWDTADFHANDFLRLIYLYGETPIHLRFHAKQWRAADQLDRDRNLPTSAEQQMTKALLEFKYWMDEEPKAQGNGRLIKAHGDYDEQHDGRKKDDEYRYEMTFWSENHQILFPTAEYLAGQWMPDGIFMPGHAFRDGGKIADRGDYDGQTRMARAKPRILRWLNDRLRFGFSEWNAPGYYKEHLQALFNLGEYCVDDEIRTRTHMVMDVLFYDLARFSHAGLFGATVGRRVISSTSRAAGSKAWSTCWRWRSARMAASSPAPTPRPPCSPRTASTACPTPSSPSPRTTGRPPSWTTRARLVQLRRGARVRHRVHEGGGHPALVEPGRVLREAGHRADAAGGRAAWADVLRSVLQNPVRDWQAGRDEDVHRRRARHPDRAANRPVAAGPGARGGRGGHRRFRVGDDRGLRADAR